MCPECGASIERSWSGPLLANANRQWLRRVTRGQLLLSVGSHMTVLGTMAVLFLGMTFAILEQAAGFTPSWDWPGVIMVTLIIGAVWAGLLLASAGCVLVTTPDPRDTGRESRTSPRMVARASMVASVALVGAGELLELSMSVPMQTLSAWVTLAGFAAFSVGLIAVTTRLSVLATRVPNAELAAELARAARFLRWALPVLLLMAGYMQIRPILPVTNSMDAFLAMVGVALTCSGSILALIMVCYLIGALFLLSRLAREMRATLESIAPDAE